MKIEIHATAEDAASFVHDLVVEQLTATPATVLGLPTGATPHLVYAALVASFRAGRCDWRAVSTFNLDEYRGLGGDHPQSFAHYMRSELFDHINCPAASIHIPDGLAPDPRQEAASYEAAIAAAGGTDLLLLGLGGNAHIGFNEPGSPHDSLTRLVTLAPNTIARNARYFPPGMTLPTQAMTMGIGTILRARRLVLLVTGGAKAEALRASLYGPLSEAVPGSALQRHDDVLIVADADAASALPEPAGGARGVREAAVSDGDPSRVAYTGARIFDGTNWHERSAVVVAGGNIEAIIAADSPTDARRVALNGGTLAPGFIDLQINGAGGAQFNLTPDLATIETICAKSARFGVSGCLPTLITDTREQNAAAIAAGIAAAKKGVPGFLGLHLEGPHLSVARKGAHDPALIRPMDEADLLALIAARSALPNLLTTVATEAVSPEQIARLTEAGIIVSIGHSNASYAMVRRAAEAGASMVTHLFNAQSQLGNREPGVVGAALDLGTLSAGLIADGIHVDAISIGVALRAKRGPGHIFLVSDAMSVIGTEVESFELTGQTVYRKDGALRLADGTLAGADLTMVDAVGYVHRTLGVSLEETLRMVSLYPAEVLGSSHLGRIATGYRADLVHLGDDLAVRGTLIGGEQAWPRRP